MSPAAAHGPRHPLHVPGFLEVLAVLSPDPLGVTGTQPLTWKGPCQGSMSSMALYIVYCPWDRCAVKLLLLLSTPLPAQPTCPSFRRWGVLHSPHTVAQLGTMDSLQENGTLVTYIPAAMSEDLHSLTVAQLSWGN